MNFLKWTWHFTKLIVGLMSLWKSHNGSKTNFLSKKLGFVPLKYLFFSLRDNLFYPTLGDRLFSHNASPSIVVLYANYLLKLSTKRSYGFATFYKVWGTKFLKCFGTTQYGAFAPASSGTSASRYWIYGLQG